MHFSYDSFSQNGFSADQRSGCAPLLVTFSYLEGANPTYLSWDFGTSNNPNGDPANNPSLLNPFESFSEPGTYTISLEVTNDNGTTTYTYTDYITVFADPSPNFVADVTEGCGSFPVQFTDLSDEGDGEIVQWNWDFGDAGSSTEQNPLYIYSTIGLYDVSLSVTDINGCNSIFSIQDYINSTDGVYPLFTTSPENACTVPITVSINNLSSGDGEITYAWDFGNSTFSNLENPPAPTYANYGTYDITLTMSSDLGCTQSYTYPMVIEEFEASFETETLCFPDTVFFNNISDPQMNTFSWDFGDPSSGSQNSSSQENPYHIFTSAGSFTVSLTASIDGDCEDTYSMEIEVLDVDEIDFTIDPSFICELPFQMPLIINNSDIVDYNWTIVHGESDNFLDSGDENNNIINLIDSTYEGGYDLLLNVTYENGCEKTLIEEDIFIVDTLDIQGYISPYLACIGDTILGIDSTIYVSDIESYIWDWDDGSYDYTSNPFHIYNTPGTYEILLSLTAENGCQNEKVLTAFVGIETNPSFTYPQDTLCIEDSLLFTFTGDTSIVDTYIWTYNGTSQGSDINQYITFNDIGEIHTVTLETFNNGCGDTIQSEVFVNALGPMAVIGMLPDFFCKEESPFISNISNAGTSTPNTIYQWAFEDDYLDSTTAYSPGPLQFFEAGEHLISLIATDTVTGCEHENESYVRIDNFNIFFTQDNTHGCDTLYFTGEMGFTDILDVSPQMLYTWDFGDNTIGFTQGITDSQISHDYVETGPYFISTSSINSYGCTDTVSQWVFNHPSPIAFFSIETENICPPFNLNVNNLSTAMDTAIIYYQYMLSYDDSVYYDEENPVVFIEEAVPYQLSLNIEDGYGCSDDYSIELDPHSIDMLYSVPENMCYGVFYQVENNISSEYMPLTFFWEFGNGFNSFDVEPNIIIDFNVPNDFINYVTVTDASGCSQVDTFYIHMSVPTIDFDYLVDEANCPPVYVDFSISSTDSILEFGIDYGDGEFNYVNSAEEALDMSHVYDFPGFYDVIFIVSDSIGCESHILSDSLVFVPGPWAEFSFDPDFGCPPLEVTFEIIDENNVEDYFWVFGDGSSAEIPNTTHIYNLAGTYTPTLIVIDSLNLSVGDSLPCIVTVQEEDIIIEGPVIDFFILEDTLCFGSTNSVSIENTTQDQAGFTINSYEWQYGDGSISNFENPPAYAYADTGYFTITLTITTTNGCVYTMEKENAVYVMPPPQINPYSVYDPSCPPMTVYFYGDSLNEQDPNIEYLWIFGDGQVSSDFITSHDYLSDESFAPSLETSFDGCTFTSYLENEIQSFPVPEAIINATPFFTDNSITEIVLTNESIDEDYIEWQLNSSYYSDENDIILTIQNDSTLVHLIAFNELGCKDTTQFSLLDFDWDIVNIITPNNDGQNDSFVLNLGGFGPCIELQIYNRWGRLVYENYNYQDNWKGVNQNGKELSDATYFYIVNVCRKSKKAGYITLLR